MHNNIESRERRSVKRLIRKSTKIGNDEWGLTLKKWENGNKKWKSEGKKWGLT